MPELIFDGRKIQVPDGTHLVDAGRAAGVEVPVFCYQKDLGAVGSCRVCAVTAKKDGQSKLVMGCMTKAEDGQEVTTTDDASVAFRRRVIEWLMINHPHDCPICDEGGECQLQDLTIACGHGRREYQGKKRTFRNQFLGEFISHEMNRCITCYRCSRFYQEYAGGRDFSATGSRDRVYFGRFEDGPFESPFSGNLVELCPTGVFTDRRFRYRSRVWDLEIGTSICPHCSVGCNVRAGSRYREIQRVRVRENPAVNGMFLCDRGQFGHGAGSAADRPRRPHVHGDAVDWSDALGRTGGWLAAIAREHGPAAVALIASPRASLETHAALEALASGSLEGARVAHFDDPERERAAFQAVSAIGAAGLPPLEQPDLARADVLLVLGASLVDEAPLAALAARQCARRGGSVFVLGPLDRSLDGVARVTPVHPARLAGALGAIAARAGIEGVSALADAEAPGRGMADDIAAALQHAQRPAILVGTDLTDGPTLAGAAALARGLAGDGRDVRFGAVFPGPNGCGAAALGEAPALTGIVDGIERGGIHAAVLVESDLDDLSPALRAALARLELLVVADYMHHALTDRARVVLPTTSVYESHGTFVNRAGRMQGFAPAQPVGLPIVRRIEDEKFPRDPHSSPPGGEALPAWTVLERLRSWTGGAGDERELGALRAALARRAGFERIEEARPGRSGAPMDAGTWATRDVAGKEPFLAPADGLALFRHERTLGSEPLSRRIPAMAAMAGPAVARLAPEDLEALGADGRVTLERDGARIEIDAVADPTVPRGAVLVPRDALLEFPPGQGLGVQVRATAREGVTR